MRTTIACGILHHVKQPISFPRPHCCVRALPLWLRPPSLKLRRASEHGRQSPGGGGHSPPLRGGRSAERRSGACEAPVEACHDAARRRLRGALRPMTRDARLSALHRGDFGPRSRFLFRHLRRISELPQPDAWRGGPGPPGASGYKPPPQDATPRSAFRMSPETPLKERGCNRCSLAAISSQEINSSCSHKILNHAIVCVWLFRKPPRQGPIVNPRPQHGFCSGLR